ncbi:MAG TPA: hypothetical protein V6C91_00025, partial [Coleofasciculaceae cyanobacterium]
SDAGEREWFMYPIAMTNNTLKGYGVGTRDGHGGLKRICSSILSNSKTESRCDREVARLWVIYSIVTMSILMIPRNLGGYSCDRCSLGSPKEISAAKHEEMLQSPLDFVTFIYISH